MWFPSTGRPDDEYRMGPIADDQDIRAPSVRRCERCGRVEQWNSRRTTWECRRPSEKGPAETRHCIHEWNVTGSFCPVSSATTESGQAG